MSSRSARFRAEARTVAMVWQRELLVFRRNPTRLLVTLVQPLAILFILGTGLEVATQAIGGLDYRTFVFPGAVAIAVVMPAFFTAGSIVQDREFGFLREMLVAPVHRSSIVLGKCLGGATVATLHGAVVVAAAGLVEVAYTPRVVLGLLGIAALLGFVLVAVGLALAARAPQFQTYMSRVNLVALPMLLASGALFPLSGLPTWLAVLTRVNPLSYAVDPMRRVVFPVLDFSEPVAQHVWLAPPELRVTWGDWIVPAWLELGLLVALGAAAFAVATVRLTQDR